MPIYEYRCTDCEVSFEALVRPGHLDDAECPHCNGHQLSREMSTFASRTNGNGSSEVAQAMNGNGLGAALSAPRGGCCGGGCGCH
jgi:putative FmdB family regulatory protein